MYHYKIFIPSSITSYECIKITLHNAERGATYWKTRVLMYHDSPNQSSVVMTKPKNFLSIILLKKKLMNDTFCKG